MRPHETEPRNGATPAPTGADQDANGINDDPKDSTSPTRAARCFSCQLPCVITFFAAGMPQPKGSARAFWKPGMTRAIVVQDNNWSNNRDKGKTWQGVVSTAAVEAGVKPLEGPVSVSLVFLVPRPRSHYGTGKNASTLKASAPAHPSTKPDVDKLARACLDAMTGVAYRDDAQVFDLVAMKAYCGYSGEERAGVFVTICQALASGAVAR